jgi:hypothetical protein
MQWSKKNTIGAGLITFVPVLGAASWVKMSKGPGKFIGGENTGTYRFIGKSSGGERIWGWGLDEFVGFNGSRGGPLDGMLKVFQMWR